MVPERWPRVPLVPFSTVDRSVLRWLRSAGRPEAFTLSAGDQELLRLQWPVERGGPIDVALADAHWTIERNGFVIPRLRAVMVAGAAETLGAIHGHALSLPGTDGFLVHRLPGLELPSWQVADRSGTEVVHLEPVREGRRLAGGAVLVSPAGTALPRLAVLLALTWAYVAFAWVEDELAVPYEELLESPNNPDVD